MAHRRIAFTLVEVIVVVAILAVLAALLYPVLAKAKEGSKMATCRSNLRQRFVALQLYRDTVDGTDVPADSESMGFPAHLDCVLWPQDCWTNAERRLACSGRHPRMPGWPVGYRQFWPPPRHFTAAYSKEQEAKWIEYLHAAGPGALVLTDMNHPLHFPANDWTIQRAFGIAMDGSLKTRVRRGDPNGYDWWLP